MRFREIASRDHKTPDRLRTCTLYVEAGRFPDLTACRLAHGRPTRIVAVRSLAPRFKGCSVDVLCDGPEAALGLLVAWAGSGGYGEPRSAAT